MKKSDFRIVEYNGTFRVQRLFETPKGRGCKKRTVAEWSYICENGHEPFYFRGIALNEPMKSFTNLADAWLMVSIIIQGKIYHT